MVTRKKEYLNSFSMCHLRSSGMLFVFVCFNVLLYRHATALKAPVITEHPPAHSSFKVGEAVTLPCMADQESRATYTWKKDGKKLDLPSGRLSLVNQQLSGYLIVRSPDESEEGVYQCFASNEMGTAVTVRSVLKKAFFYSFPTVPDPPIQYPKVGEPLTLKCTPPLSFPKDIPYWGISRTGDKEFHTLNNDNRVLLDYDGHLHFANIIDSDARDDFEYICILHNSRMGAHMHGNNIRIRPQPPISGQPQYRPPSLRWSSPLIDIAVKGQNKKMKCIFGGYPTPKVTWRRVGKELNSRMNHTKDGQGTELEILNTDETDSGEYECSATNSASGSQTHRVKLIVHSKPFWNQGRAPVDVEVEEEGSAKFTCLAHGTPKPFISWRVNGINLEDLHSDSRRWLDGDTLHFRNVTKSDTLVVQCEAENDHGSILANARLTVISEPPSFTKVPHDATVVVGGNVTFECHAYGAPPPAMKWLRGNPPRSLAGQNYRIENDGSLVLQKVTLDDEDDYICVATNKHETKQVKAGLAVREPTIISPPPPEVLANRSDDVILKCDVTTDAKESKNLKVEWRRDGKLVDYNLNTHLVMDPETYSLTVRRSMVSDTAKYTCHADNGIDSAESSPTQLIIRDRPEAPTDLQIDCTAHYAEVSFVPGSDNNDPIAAFTVYYSVDNMAELTKGPVITRPAGGFIGGRIMIKVDVQPWRTYQFYVAATNSLGMSEPSSAASQPCTTPEDRPNANPQNVCSKLRGSGQLVITWNPVPREQHFGSEFQYVVGYKRLGNNEQQKVVYITDPTVTEFAVHDLPVFTAYEISVWCENKYGPSPFGTRERKTVYSSEGKPLVSPNNFRLNENRLNGTYAEFVWDPVDSSAQKIQGFFRGYRIKFWKTGNENDIRTEDVIVSKAEIDLCPHSTGMELPPARRRRQIRSVLGSTHKLWPYSSITAGVAVLNSGHDGELSNLIEFQTPEGPPEAVRDLIVTNIGSSHMTVAWSLPVYSNGVILSFVLEYQVAPPDFSILRKEVIDNPSILSRKILGLQAQTNYRITLYAVTAAGTGEAIFVNATTLQDSHPDEPKIYRVEAGVDSANVSFVPTAHPPKHNPGSKFYVEYAKEGTGNEWNKTAADPHSPENWVQVKDLEPGVYYFRVVAVNGRDGHTQERRSEAMRIVIGEPRDYEASRPGELVQHAGASTSWFIVLMCIIVLLIIVLLIICYLKHSRGDVYPVYEKEKMLGRDPFAPEDTPFGEYNNTSKPDHTRSQGSLNSEDKPMDSDEDSLGEYEDQDTSKFNEDGSFIGMYVGGSKSRPNASTPHSVNTFV